MSGPDLSHVAQFLQRCGGCSRWRVALLHQVRQVAMVTVSPKPVTLCVATSPPLFCLGTTREGNFNIKETSQERKEQQEEFKCVFSSVTSLITSVLSLELL